MCNYCDKLPPKLERKDKETFNDFLDRVYPIYREQFNSSNLCFRGKPVILDSELTFNLRARTFEHITNSQRDSKDLQYHWRRSKRFHWISAILKLVKENECCDKIRVFQERNNKNSDWIIWCPVINYVIILIALEKKYKIKTAYCILYEYKLEQMTGNWLEYQKRQPH